MTDTTNVLATLERLMKEATPGPLEAEQDIRGDGEPLPYGSIYAGEECVTDPLLYRDARLLAALRNAAPALLELWKAARAYKHVRENAPSVTDRSPIFDQGYVNAIMEAQNNLAAALRALDKVSL